MEQLIKKVKAYSTGNKSIVVVIPEEVCKKNNITKNSRFIVLTDENRIIYEPIREAETI